MSVYPSGLRSGSAKAISWVRIPLLTYYCIPMRRKTSLPIRLGTWDKEVGKTPLDFGV